MILTQETNDLEIEICEEQLILSCHRAVYWPAEKALVVADMHLGKSATFRQSGIPIPSSVQAGDLHRLSSLLAKYPTKTLIVVGDMFHQDFNNDLASFTDWRNAFDGLRIILVQGNHDKLHMIQYRHMGIDLYKPNMNLGPFQFIHKVPANSDEHFYISGHIHPGVRLTGRAKQAIKLPCFRRSANGLILPAFSVFTGLDVSRCEEECTYYAVLENSVVEL